MENQENGCLQANTPSVVCPLILLTPYQLIVAPNCGVPLTTQHHHPEVEFCLTQLQPSPHKFDLLLP